MNEIKNFINPNAIQDKQCCNIDSTGIACTNTRFTQQFRIKQISKFQSGNGQEGYMLIPVFVCTKCNHEIELK